MLRIAGDSPLAHHVLIPAFLGKEARLYSIDLVFSPDRKKYAFRYTRHLFNDHTLVAPRTPRMGAAGSGASYLGQDRKWVRPLYQLLKANDRGRVSSYAVADYLARLNYEVHLADKSVGPRCVVAWQHRKGGVHKIGGANQFYIDTARANSLGLPTITNGMDLNALCGVLMQRSMKRLEAMQAGQQIEALEVDKDEINAKLGQLPQTPDEQLR
jgi:hypothetical protein